MSGFEGSKFLRKERNLVVGKAEKGQQAVPGAET